MIEAAEGIVGQREVTPTGLLAGETGQATSERRMCLGIDVSDRMLTLAVDDGQQPAGVFGEIPYRPGALRAALEELRGAGMPLKAAYLIESASCALGRWLAAFDVETIIASQPEIRKRRLASPTERERTAFDLAIRLRNGTLTPATLVVPCLVAEAMTAARNAGFGLSCIPEFGRLLHVLATLRRGGRFAEIGTGCGVGTAWMASAAAGTSTPITSVEIEPARAEAARTVLSRLPNVSIEVGDWRGVFSDAGAYDLVFADGAYSKGPGSLLVDMVAPGGIVVMDDIVPWSHWDDDEWGGSDIVRDFWFGQHAEDFTSTEVMTAPDASAIIAVKR